MNDKREEEVSLSWARRRGRPAKPKATTDPPLRIPRSARLMALAIKFQEMVDRGEVRDYADLARLGYVTRARLTQIMNLLLLEPDIQQRMIFSTGDTTLSEHRIRTAVKRIRWATQLAVLLASIDEHAELDGCAK
jgi:hypothetical protein